MLRQLLRCGVPVFLLVCACESSPDDSARKLFPDRSRTLATDRPFRKPAATPAGLSPGTCPPVLQDVASGTSARLRSWAEVEERRSEGNRTIVTRWQKGYYVPMDPSAAGLSKGEAYGIRCDRLAATDINVPDVQPRM